MSLSTELSRLRGKKLVAVHLRPFDDGLGEKTYNPVFVFEGGVSVRFVVHETDYGCSYGIDPGVVIQETERAP